MPTKISQLGATQVIGWGTPDVGLSRSAAGTLAIGTGAAGNAGGTLALAGIALNGATLGSNVFAANSGASSLTITNTGRLDSPFLVSTGNIRLTTTGTFFWLSSTELINVADGVYKFRTTAGGQNTVATLPAAATAGAGARAFVTDANTTLAAGIGTVVVGGGANGVPVVCTGANWLIG